MAFGEFRKVLRATGAIYWEGETQRLVSDDGLASIGVKAYPDLGVLGFHATVIYHTRASSQAAIWARKLLLLCPNSRSIGRIPKVSKVWRRDLERELRHG